MIGHQRDVLHALGIDIWVPKAQVCQQRQPALWRDQAPPEPISEIILVARAPEAAPLLHKEALQPAAAETGMPVQADPPKLEVLEEPVRPVLHIDPFVIEAVSMEHCVLLIDAAALNAEQQLLWSNIQRAVRSEFSMLQWPFAWLQLQDGRGAASYVSGFIDGMREGRKNILCLGQIPHLESSEYIALASLQDMLQEPKLKKRLWQFMQNKPKDTV